MRGNRDNCSYSTTTFCYADKNSQIAREGDTGSIHTNSIAPSCAGSRQTHVHAPTFSSPHRSQGEAYARVCVVRALK